QGRPGPGAGAGSPNAGAAHPSDARMDAPPVSQAPLRVPVAGTGAFGKNHLRVYRELEAAGPHSAGLSVALVAAGEPDSTRAAETAERYAIPVFASAGELLAADLNLLVEKPLAASLTEADDLIARAERGKRILQPGHLERFNPAVLAIQLQ